MESASVSLTKSFVNSAENPPAELGAFLVWLDNTEQIRSWLESLGARNSVRAAADFRDLLRRTRSLEAQKSLANLIGQLLPFCPDPGMALINLDRFVAASPESSQIVALLESQPRAIEILLQLFGTSQHFSETLIRQPDHLAWLLKNPSRRSRDELIERLWSELSESSLDNEVRRGVILRQFRERENLRIGYNDIVRGWPLEIVTEDLSHLADACINTACRYAWESAISRFGSPKTAVGGGLARFVILALGKLGGQELNYSSDIDLLFLYDEDGRTDGLKSVYNAEFFARVGTDVIRLLTDCSYRVDMRLRPHGQQGPLTLSLAGTIGYYEAVGRTWERQALIKCRPIAGDLDLGEEFLQQIRPFIYRRYLGSAEIGEIQAIKRRIEQRTKSAGADDWEVKTGRGGIRDVEFAVQFLQLLHGGVEPEVHDRNTLRALAKLQATGCLQAEEREIMEETYRFLRKIEHRLQTMFNRQTHEMPRDAEELRILALRMGQSPAAANPAGLFLDEYRSKTELNRKILNHLFHDAFNFDDANSAPAHPVVDVVLDPNPTTDQIAEALRDFRFKDYAQAYENLAKLAKEDIPFLSRARCRHFLASIAPRLLQELSQTPDPDLSLTNLEKVSASLGAKAVLWELFHVHPPSLRLYVELCSTSQFLSEILINNPGMIDDLMDSLVDDRVHTKTEIEQELEELCVGAQDLFPILLGFRNKEWMRTGVRDILGREPIRLVTRELADVAEAILKQCARLECRHRNVSPNEPPWAILALGKFGGRELSHHSDLDLIVLFDEQAESAHPQLETQCQLWTRSVLKTLGGSTTRTRLYQADLRLRPYGNDGSLICSLAHFVGYHEGGLARPWEMLTLCRARLVFGSGAFANRLQSELRRLLTLPILSEGEWSREIQAIRPRFDCKTAPKRLCGDIELVVYYLQKIHGAAHPEVLQPNLWDALEALEQAQLISPEVQKELAAAYDFLRSSQNRLRLVYNRAEADFPDASEESALARLARRTLDQPFEPKAMVAAFLAERTRTADLVSQRFRELVQGQGQDK